MPSFGGGLMSKEQAEKFFNKKASPESYMEPKEFLKKKVVEPVKNYGKNVAGGARIVGGAVRRFGRSISSGINKFGTKIGKDLFGSPELDAKQKAAGAALNSAYSKRRSTSDGSMR